MANTLIEEGLVLDYTLHGCMRYNPACRIKQCFNCYEYGHVSVHYQKSTKCGACLGPHRTLECARDKVQKCPLCNGAHTSWDKRCEHRKKEYLRIQAAKENTSRLYKVRSNTPPPQRTENLRDMRPLPRPQQRSQSVNASPQAPIPQPSVSMGGKRGRSSSNDRPPLQTTSGNASRFTAPAKVQMFERPTTRSQRHDTADSQDL